MKTDTELWLSSLVSQIRVLTRSNAELKQFASVIAHDLRNPLLSLSGCAEMLEYENERLSENGREAVKYILDSVRHMDRLITGLLERSHTGKNRLKKTHCRIEQVLAAVLSSLRATLDDAGIQVTHDPLPMVQADTVLIDELLQNLIENAAKYRNGTTPRIHVSAWKAAGEWIFSICDNGIGINSRDLERIFQPFERLHGEGEKYSGLGLGLAVCKQIVESHGGRIWAESRPGQGAAFFFSLPDKTPNVSDPAYKALSCRCSSRFVSSRRSTKPAYLSIHTRPSPMTRAMGLDFEV